MKASGFVVALAACFTTFAALPARAQAPDAANVRIPFSFVVGTRLMPAGHYSITADDDTPSVLLIRSDDGRHFAVVDTEWGTSRLTETPTLRFAVYGTNHFLTGVRLAGESKRMLPVTRRDVTREIARLDTERATHNGE